MATGTSGHGSIPRLDNAVAHLSAAVGESVGLGDAAQPERDHPCVLRAAGRDFAARPRGALPGTVEREASSFSGTLSGG